MLSKRSSGILLHITSLPSAHGIGDLGPAAYQFADFLTAARQNFWQILPLNPIDGGLGNSPYSSASAFAGNTLLISLELLVRDGFLLPEEIGEVPHFAAGRVAYDAVRAFKNPLLHKAYQRFFAEASTEERCAYEAFCREHSGWLDDYTLFVALNIHFNYQNWNEWPTAIRDRHPEAMQEYRERLSEPIRVEKFLQFIFFRQWFALKAYCAERGIHFIGDLPIYVHFQSADVWSNPQVFKLDGDKKPYVVAGVPPDYFSETGQLWGNPVYNWDYLREHRYAWWKRRMKHNVKTLDLVRLDHFLAFVSYWEVDAREKTAIHGKWVDAPAEDFFRELLRQHPRLPIIAEDLGIITPAVRHFMDTHHFPGMRVLVFAFGGDVAGNLYSPHNHVENCIVYTGTHDNNTTRGWYSKEANYHTRKQVQDYIGHEVSDENVAWQMIRLGMMSVAKTVIIPMQDALNLGEEARMNTPGTTGTNWGWRMRPDQVSADTAARLSEVTSLYGRG
jgi:4-alpha-glucanotransferase